MSRPGVGTNSVFGHRRHRVKIHELDAVVDPHSVTGTGQHNGIVTKHNLCGCGCGVEQVFDGAVGGHKIHINPKDSGSIFRTSEKRFVCGLGVLAMRRDQL